MYCRSCRYPLRRLSDERCPECGRAFDSGDERTFLEEADAPRRLRRSIGAYLLFNLLVVGGLLLVARAFLSLFL